MQTSIHTFLDSFPPSLKTSPCPDALRESIPQDTQDVATLMDRHATRIMLIAQKQKKSVFSREEFWRIQEETVRDAVLFLNEIQPYFERIGLTAMLYSNTSRWSVNVWAFPELFLADRSAFEQFLNTPLSFQNQETTLFVETLLSSYIKKTLERVNVLSSSFDADTDLDLFSLLPKIEEKIQEWNLFLSDPRERNFIMQCAEESRNGALREYLFCYQNGFLESSEFLQKNHLLRNASDTQPLWDTSFFPVFETIARNKKTITLQKRMLNQARQIVQYMGTRVADHIFLQDIKDRLTLLEQTVR